MVGCLGCKKVETKVSSLGLLLVVLMVALTAAKSVASTVASTVVLMGSLRVVKKVSDMAV